MMIETTVNCPVNINEILLTTASEYGISRSKIVVLLLKEMMRNHHKLLRCDRSVQYQERDSEGGWHCLHITFTIRDYECFGDMRKLCKKSVSLLISYAVNEYLEKVLRKIKEAEKGEEIIDNYHFIHYIIEKTIVDNIICWRIYWGLPEKYTNTSP